MTYNFTIPNKRKKFVWIDWGMAIAGLLLLFFGKFIPAALLFIMSGMGYFMRKDLSFSFGDDEIIFNIFPKKNIEWSQLNNVILKDGILTIDFKNNRLLQEIVLIKDKDFNEADFNNFCKWKLQND